MARVANRIVETTSTTGTGAFSLGGAKNSQTQKFLDEFSDGDTVYYWIEHQQESFGEWEFGEGTISSGNPDTLSRDRVISSSNSDAAVDFSGGEKDVFVGPAAETAVVMNDQESLAADDVLRWDATNEYWVAEQPAFAASEITSGTFADARIAQSSVTQHEGAISHDALSGFVANEHVDHAGVSITAGNGLTGGGDLTASRTLAVASGGIGTDELDLSIAPTWKGQHQFDADVTLVGEAYFNGRPLYDRIVEIVEGVIESRLPTEKYDLSNVTTDRVLDADSTSDAELADVLATLIRDLRMAQ